MSSQQDTQAKGAGFRNKRTAPFTMLANAMLRNPELSLKAKGLLAVMLSFPDDWQYHMRHIEGLSSDGRDGHRAALIELEQIGYVRRRQTRDERGRVAHAVYTVSDEILTVDGFSVAGETDAGESATTNTDSTKTDRTKKKDGAASRAGQEPAPSESDPHLPPVRNPSPAGPQVGIASPPTASEKVPGGGAAARAEDMPLPGALTALPGFAEAWAEWLAYRRSRKLTTAPATLKRQLGMLGEQPDPVAVIEQTITNGWNGLFPLKGSATPARPQTQAQANERFTARMEDTRQAVRGVFDD